jgi:hypothetical protein
LNRGGASSPLDAACRAARPAAIDRSVTIVTSWR